MRYAYEVFSGRGAGFSDQVLMRLSEYGDATWNPERHTYEVIQDVRPDPELVSNVSEEFALGYAVALAQVRVLRDLASLGYDVGFGHDGGEVAV